MVKTVTVGSDFRSGPLFKLGSAWIPIEAQLRNELQVLSGEEVPISSYGLLPVPVLPNREENERQDDERHESERGEDDDII
eukprot:766760-Hanusia_phi.AAC.2